MTDSEAMLTIINWMIEQSSNKVYIANLNKIADGIRGQKHIEESRDPKFQAIELGYWNLFPFKMQDYRKMALLIKSEEIKNV